MVVHGKKALMLGTGIASVAIVFVLDLNIPMQGIAPLLYIACLIVFAQVTTQHGTLLLATVICIQILASYGHSHENVGDLPAIFKLALSLGVLFTVCAMISYSKALGSRLASSTVRLVRSEASFMGMFRESETALWLQDFSAVRRYLMALKSEGVTDLLAYERSHPELVSRAISQIRTRAINQSAACQFEGIALNESTFLDLLETIFTQRTHFEDAASTAGALDRRLRMRINFPENTLMFDKVVVSLTDCAASDGLKPLLGLSDHEHGFAKVSNYKIGLLGG
ncbi:hypothetical protein CPY51_30310 [Rhizobium tubonense]|uniref:Uncharacterized protein n=2 Tax=Rhizobium tubonense TaxID=484088 RepID=A0A2W4E6N0_9HYPH|nr:hypothetical protein CPY51_30310 [Rhizobium tubonense]